MQIEDLKQHIENKDLDDSFIIFQYSDIDFIAHQYIKAISTFKNLPIKLLDEFAPVNNIFEMKSFDLNIFITDTFNYSNKNTDLSNYIVICKKIDKSTELLYNDNIVKISKLEDWQIKDYVYSNIEVDKKLLDTFILDCNNDIFKIDNELQKLIIFDKKEHQFFFNKFIENNIFSNSNRNIIFDFSNAIIKRDINKVNYLYNKIKLTNADVEPLGLVTILYNNFKNIIKIQLSKNPTAESCGMKSNQFWAIKNNNIGYYSKEELINIFEKITHIDYQLKSGLITTDKIIDYLLVNIL